MSQKPYHLSQIRKIDNSRQWLPFATTLLVLTIFFIAYWFFRGGSLRLYASGFFGLYFLTKRIWISVILLGIFQNIFLLPLRFVSLYLSSSLKDFEDALDHAGSEKEQYFLFNKKVKEGNVAIIFYIFNFILSAVAFFSAGRLFLIDFYATRLDPNLLYKFIPYPDYPLKGTLFNFPFLKVTDTIALDWRTIIFIWAGLLLAFTIPRLLWRFVRFIFWKNQKILSARINYNRLLAQVGGITGTTFLLSLFILRHIPTAFQGIMLTADLTIPNRALNFITAIGTFITTLHAGYNRHSLAVKEAKKADIPQDVIDSVFKEKMRQTFKNALLLGFGAFAITSQIPSAFELSVATFEVLYILSPYTFDRLLKLGKPNTHALAST